MKQTREIWRAVPMFDAYEVSNLGRVRRVKRGEKNGAPRKVLKPWAGVGGETYVTLRAEAHSHTCAVSALVEIAFRRRRPSRERVA